MKTIDDTNDCNVYSSSNFTEEIKGEVCARIQFYVISTFGNLNWPQKAQVKAKVCKEKEKLYKCILSKISKKERKDIQMAYKAKKVNQEQNLVDIFMLKMNRHGLIL